VSGTCDCVDEPSGSIKCGEFLEAENLLASQEGLYCMKRLSKEVSKNVRSAVGKRIVKQAPSRGKRCFHRSGKLSSPIASVQL
jgi:hypothetical protein